MYHVIASPPPGAPFPGLYVMPSEFAAQMQALKSAGWHAVTLDQVQAYWQRGVPLGAGKPIVVSFDNGYQSQYTQALPVLRRLGWVGDENVQLTGLPPSQGGLSQAQVHGLVAAGWELDTQGFSHADLITLNAQQLNYQVAVARSTVRQRYHVPVNWFCYPSGHYDATVIAAVREAGYTGSTTGCTGCACSAAPRHRRCWRRSRRSARTLRRRPPTAAPETVSARRRPRIGRLAGIVVVIVLAALIVFALSRLQWSRIGHALITATPGWVALALVLMALSLLLRSASWHETLRAALPETQVGWAPVARATMIGVLASALFPGRIGEPTRVLVLTRRLDGPASRLVPVLAGTVFSQTLINLLALAILAAVTFTGVPLLHGDLAGVMAVLAVPLALCVLVLVGPRLLRLGRRSRSARVVQTSNTIARLLELARRGLRVFARPRYGSTAIAFQLLAWVLQWLACYMIVLALGLQSQANLVSAAAILLAVNVSAVLPATPSNVGVFQAACLVVLAAYGVGAGPGLAYGIILQSVEVLTALGLGIPALLAEGLRWRDIRPNRLEPPNGLEPLSK
jgi:uncharacterized protein (TIRG00374 family)